MNITLQKVVSLLIKLVSRHFCDTCWTITMPAVVLHTHLCVPEVLHQYCHFQVTDIVK